MRAWLARLQHNVLAAFGHPPPPEPQIEWDGDALLDWIAGDDAAAPELLDPPGGAFATIHDRAAALPSPAWEKLSPREREVALLVAKDLSNSQIAETMYLSTLTVRSHVRTTYQKLGLSDKKALKEFLKQELNRHNLTPR